MNNPHQKTYFFNLCDYKPKKKQDFENVFVGLLIGALLLAVFL